MKIGLITFHWATNYGAVLQCFALQETLSRMGHDLSVINYKPSIYDNTLWSFIRRKKFLNIGKYLVDIKKESLIENFRKKHLHQTKRYESIKQLQTLDDFDVLITGSDQVLNHTFLSGGEQGGSTAYYLDFGGEKCKRMSYAASFGTTIYPKDCTERVLTLVARFNAISVRENSGVEIFRSMGRQDTVVVPDPTFLLRSFDYRKLFTPSEKSQTISAYLLHGREAFIKGLNQIDYVNNNGGSIEEWLNIIHSSKGVVTNSFHGTVFCIHFHIPFVVVLETLENKGMNDRFFSMLTKVGLRNRITEESNFDARLFEEPIDWENVDCLVEKYRREGIEFLKSNLLK